MVTGSPIALISLLTSRRQWFKARVGLPAAPDPARLGVLLARDPAGRPFVVEDAIERRAFFRQSAGAGRPAHPLLCRRPAARQLGHGDGHPVRDRPRTAQAARAELQALVDLAAIAAAEIQRPNRF
jgi:hypothetical protein